MADEAPNPGTPVAAMAIANEEASGHAPVFWAVGDLFDLDLAIGTLVFFGVLTVKPS
jgi:hypothetical protein